MDPRGELATRPQIILGTGKIGALVFPGDVPSQRPSATRASSPGSHLSLLARPGGQIWGTCQGEVGCAGAEEIHAALAYAQTAGGMVPDPL